MKRFLNTLFVSTQGAYLKKDRENIVIEIEGAEAGRFPVHLLGQVACFGNVMCSPFVMGLCAESGVAVSFLTENGRYLSRMVGKTSGNVLLRKQQFRASEDEGRAAQIAKAIVAGKVANQRTVLMRALRDHPEIEREGKIARAIDLLKNNLENLAETTDIDRIRGIEGDSANMYFGAFDDLILCQKEDFFFKDRNRRPPTDNVNALLSFAYTLLMLDCRSALESVGLDPQVGFLHADRPGRPSLALDLMEEFRPVLADRIALSMINRQQLRKSDFVKSESGAVEMKDDARKRLITEYQEKKKAEVTHPFLDEKMETGLLFHIQALLLARHLRGDLDGYPPYVWR
jgi:CRISPR-associated protein Cas1